MVPLISLHDPHGKPVNSSSRHQPIRVLPRIVILGVSFVENNKQSLSLYWTVPSIDAWS